MEYKNLLLVCASGITTGLLVRNMKKEVDQQNLPINIYSAPSITLKYVLQEEQIDGVLIGPQIQHELSDISNLLREKGIPFASIDKADYEALDGKAVLAAGEQVLD